MWNIFQLPGNRWPTNCSPRISLNRALEGRLKFWGEDGHYFWLGRATGTGSALSALDSNLAAHCDR
jgi:hypothetical protein